MKKNALQALLIIVIGALFLTACASAPNVDWNLSITGDVASPITVSYKELSKMPQTDLKDILMDKSIGEDEVGSWSGVLVADLLQQAGAHDDFVSVTAVAGDGYAIEITRDELQNAIIAMKQEGEWIQKSDPEHGPIRMVCPQTPANRWVFQLLEIQVNQ
jgi:DMSO/TMAO reductase YedYZ molybdopterin-dependent catalytic subunit